MRYLLSVGSNPAVSVRSWKVYTLFDPRDFVTRYVGYTVSSLRVRLSSHMHDSASVGRRLHLWFTSLQEVSVTPGISALYIVDDKQTARALERSTIRRMIDAGVPLLNTQSIGQLRATQGHIKLWTRFCDDFDRFSGEVTGSKVLLTTAQKSLWTGYCPTVDEAGELEMRFGIRTNDWLVTPQQMV
jgi:hypothetical protein